MTDQASDEQTVKLLVEQPITAAGSYDLDTFEGMMAANANIGWRPSGMARGPSRP